jgi:hypothetical protein
MSEMQLVADVLSFFFLFPSLYSVGKNSKSADLGRLTQAGFVLTHIHGNARPPVCWDFGW